ncbi:NAD-dependent epimerase/dehydratase family protein [Piscinibacter sp. HJYY11]|uniref:NAD-dependent epimerase/dehydratase family protein n=1 Tax=Piscinibacter sp. HJYY11 TaxID=2801333 RepID=UPI00191CE5E9|nr:NAD-dependent epimerase/dehydratase family protein [Piscinibacter sp. HJYY11]MBL0726243.1 NAD-dependent epimerase/dehydratase family protein [Piscinibacter sp. HJYY11]
MHVLITGAHGFVGHALATRLAREGELAGRALRRLSLVDLTFGGAPAQECVVHRLAGDLGDAAWLDHHLDGDPVDMVFHLASIPGGTAEANYALARRVNLDATLSLLERGKAQVEAGAACPRFVFASSIAVFGTLPELVTEVAQPRPRMTYGAQKLIGEILVDDFSRRAWVDGVSLRIPGVLARPPAQTGQLSAFLSDIIRELAAGRPFACPMSASATTWASSIGNVVDNLLHAAALPRHALGATRTFTLPTTRFSMAELVDAIGALRGTDTRPLVRYHPDDRIETLFGRFPPLETPDAEHAGFHRDADLRELVRRALDSL